jgi:mannose-6-phosphate isomerase-like protein (cupin superfamily)
MRTFLIGLLGAMVVGLSLLAQTPAVTSRATYRSAAQISAELAKAGSPAGAVGGQAVTIVPGMVLRRRMSGPNNASVHTADGDKQDVTEVYEIVDGAGTFVTGGTFANPADRTAGIKGGESRRVSKGDFIVIPAGTPHWFSSIEGSITYLEARFPTGR